MRKRTVSLVFTLLLSVGCATEASLHYETATNDVQQLTLQQPLTPEQTLTRLVAPDGFEIRVFAAEPDIVNPIALA